MAAPTIAVVLVNDDEALDTTYRLFFNPNIDEDLVAVHYREDIIHVGALNSPLLLGKQQFLVSNIAPMAIRKSKCKNFLGICQRR